MWDHIAGSGINKKYYVVPVKQGHLVTMVLGANQLPVLTY